MRAAVLFAALGLGTTLAGQVAQQPEPQTGLIVGQVIDGTTGRPISGAIVALSTPQYSPFVSARPAPPTAPRILTGADGRFVFRDMPRGSFTITATRPGYVEGAYGRRRPNGPSQQLTLALEERVGDVVIRMWKFGAISGTVVDEAGEPLVGVAIRAFRRSVVAGIKRFVDGPPAGTDDRGIYRLGNLVPGEYVVSTVSRQMSAPLSIAATQRSELMAMSVAMPGTSITIGDTVHSLGLGTPIPPPLEGERMFVYPATYYPAARAAELGTIVTVASGEERSGVDLQLAPVPTVRVSGSVMGPNGPVQIQLRLEPADITDIPQRETLTTTPGGDGQFIFPAVPSGQYMLRAAMRPAPQWKQIDAERVLWAEQAVAAGRDHITALNITLQPGLRVSGRFEFEGTAQRPSPFQLRQVGLTVEPATGGTFAVLAPVRADESGQFASAGMQPGRYFVRVLGSPSGWMFKSATYGGRDVSDTPLDLRSDASDVVITFTDKWSGLSGTVTTARGAPDAEALVVVFPTDSQMWSSYGLNFRRMKSIQTTKTGQYTFPVLAPGEYYVAALRDANVGDWQDPAFLDSLARSASQVRIDEGEKKTLDLRTVDVR